MQATPHLPITRPSLALLGAEPWRAALEFLAHKVSADAPSESGDGHPVIIFPGLATDGAAVAPLRNYCARLGYAAMDWNRGRNHGPVGDADTWLAELATHVAALLNGIPQRATLIGWSLGGLYAREVAKLLPDRVDQVITIGSPFNANADHSNVGWLYRLVNGDSAAITPTLAQRLRTPPIVPTTSIYSRSDGVVAWQTCVHARGTHARDIEVDGSHCGLGWNPSVLRTVRELLQAQESKMRARKPERQTSS